MILDELIYDRTQADVDAVSELITKGFQSMNADEKQRWLSNMKGALNADDLNRVGKACHYIEQLLIKENFFRMRTDARIDLMPNGIYDELVLNEYVDSVRRFMELLPSDLYEYIPATYDYVTYEDQNHLEKNLYLIPTVLRSIQDGMRVLQCTVGGDEFE